MRPRSQAGLPGETDGVALIYSGSLFEGGGKSTEVSVGRRIGALVANNDHLSISALPSEKIDRAVRHSANPCANRGAVVDALVGTIDLKYWM